MDPHIFSTSANIFQQLFPERQLRMSLSDVDHALVSIPTNATEVNAIAPAAADTITACLKNVFTDGKMTLSDFPIILRTINDIAKNVNTLNILNVKASSVIDVLEVIICVVFQMVLPPGEYDIARTILVPAFGLLRTNITTSKTLKMLLCC